MMLDDDNSDMLVCATTIQPGKVVCVMLLDFILILNPYLCLSLYIYIYRSPIFCGLQEEYQAKEHGPNALF